MFVSLTTNLCIVYSLLTFAVQYVGMIKTWLKDSIDGHEEAA